jgi:hypothetical protein
MAQPSYQISWKFVTWIKYTHRKQNDLERPTSLFLKNAKGAKYLPMMDSWFTDNGAQIA